VTIFDQTPHHVGSHPAQPNHSELHIVDPFLLLTLVWSPHLVQVIDAT
jgi:hypothetical protein